MSESNESDKEIRSIFKNISEYQLTFSLHFQKKAKQVRGIDEDMIWEFFNNPDRIFDIIPQTDNRYKVWFKKSSRYALVVVISVKKDKYINVITSYITSRKCQEKIRIIRKKGAL